MEEGAGHSAGPFVFKVILPAPGRKIPPRPASLRGNRNMPHRWCHLVN